MKRNAIFLMVLLVGAMSCNKVKPKKVEKTMTDGTWKVTLFSEDGINETYHFDGYTFTFSDGGGVTATNGSNTVSGSWSTSKAGSDDDSNNAHFNLTFPEVNNFDELSDDWHILTLSDSRLELEDVSGGDGSIDKLTFEKK